MRARLIAGAAIVLVLVPLAVVAVVAARFRPSWEREDPATVRREIALLSAARDSLQRRVYDAAATSDLLDAQPKGDIAIGMPTPFVDAVVQRVVAGWFNEVELHLPRMRVRKSGEVKARLGLLGRRTVGEYDLDMVLSAVRGQLQPGAPQMQFGGNVIRVAVPVRVSAGQGRARIALAWDSRGLASPVCGGLTVTRDVAGTIRPAQYTARGRIVLSAVDGAVIADPDFPALSLRLFIEPSRASIASLDSVLAIKGGLCAYAIDRSGASSRVQQMVGRGFRIRIPQRFFRPIRLPFALQTSVPVRREALSLSVIPSELAVTSSAVWVAAAVRAAPSRVDGSPTVIDSRVRP
jgi:hypothetical protein